MGGSGPRSRKKGYTSKKKFQAKARGTKRRTKDLDQVEKELKDIGRLPGEQVMEDAVTTEEKPYDEDLPGGGLFYCVESARHFASADALAKHRLSKQFKNRVKRLKEGAFTQDMAEAAVGVTKEHLPPVRHEVGPFLLFSPFCAHFVRLWLLLLFGRATPWW